METRVMKIMWTIAALASSVTLVNAQPSPPRPIAPVAPAPAPKVRVQVPDPVLAPSGQMLLPGIDWLLDVPSPMSLIAPGQMPLTPLPPLDPLEPLAVLAPMPFELPTPAMLPGQSMGIDFPPLPSLAPLAPLTPMWVDVPMAADLPSMVFPPMPVEPMLFDLRPGQGPVTRRPPPQDRELEAELRRLTTEMDRAEAARRRALDAQDRATARDLEAQQRTLQRELEQTIRSIDAQERALQRQNEQMHLQIERERAAQERTAERELAQHLREIEMQDRVASREMEQVVRSAQQAARADQALHSVPVPHYDIRVTVPAPWAPQDVADSVWRQARELFNRGEYGQAVQAFRSIPTQYPNSAYAPEASYYQAFSLFRIGGTTELREALAALEASNTKYPNARSRSQASSLATRIRGVLAQRGDAQAAAELARTANTQAVTCDREEQAVQQEAMNQLSRMEGGNINELITRVLARKDECAIPLRRTAVFLVGNRRDAQAVTILAGVARGDPSVEVRVEAINVISRLANEEGVTVLEELTRSDDERVQRAAVRALVRHPSARARTSVRGLVERDDVSERLRSDALASFDSERATADDVAWLRALYAKVTTPSLKARTLAAIVRVGGPEVDQWLVTVARDDNQPSEIRATAMRRIGQTMSVPDLARLYDSATQQRFRSEIISVLGKRKEDAATDKLIDIIKNGTDPTLRRSAINAVVNKNDARAQQLLLEIINK
jgi:TolA-binding protein